MVSSVTVRDIAREADVSIGTVSRVFNNHGNVTEEIRQRVLKVAAELGYSRPVSQTAPLSDKSLRIARGLSLKEIGFLYCISLGTTTVTSNPFWSHILGGVENEARKRQIKVTYRAIEELAQKPSVLLSTVQDMKLDGILLVGPAEMETIQLIRSLKLPVILVDNYAPGIGVDSVLCDNFEGARAAVDYLIELGHRQIGFIGGPVLPGSRPLNKIYTLERRAAGYRTALLDAGLPVNYSLFESASYLYVESGYEACNRLLERNPQLTAIFCANDELAIGVMKSLREAGRRIPEDVSLIGFDDITLVEHLTPALTTVRVNKEALGSIAFNSLMERASDPDRVHVSSVLEVELIKRQSVGPCPS